LSDTFVPSEMVAYAIRAVEPMLRRKFTHFSDFRISDSEDYGISDSDYEIVFMRGIGPSSLFASVAVSTKELLALTSTSYDHLLTRCEVANEYVTLGYNRTDRVSGKPHGLRPRWLGRGARMASRPAPQQDLMEKLNVKR